MPTNVRDPRSIITPEAFHIDEALLGTPLAKPGKRLAALLIDLVVIGVLTALTSGISVFIWGFVGLFLLGAAIRGPGRKLGQITSVLFRGSAGCLGVLILLIVALVGVASRVDMSDLEEAVSSRFEATDLSALPAFMALRTAQSDEQAREAALRLLNSAAGFDMEAESGEALRELLVLAAGEDPAFTDDPQAFADEVMARWAAAEGRPEDAGEIPGEAGPPEAASMDELSLAEVVARYDQGLQEGRSPASDATMAALRDRLLLTVAADTLDELQGALDDEQDRRADVEEALVSAQRELDDQGSGFVALLRDIWDQAGSAVGLWSIYFTVTVTLFRGFTVGKRAMGIRVVRLDGEPMGWWHAFERAGGYVAGIATGLLGFAQVYWDPNRQCVHDKIGGTVVVVAGASPVPGAWESAWSDPAGPPEPAEPADAAPPKPRRAAPGS